MVHAHPEVRQQWLNTAELLCEVSVIPLDHLVAVSSGRAGAEATIRGASRLVPVVGLGAVHPAHPSLSRICERQLDLATETIDWFPVWVARVRISRSACSGPFVILGAVGESK